MDEALLQEWRQGTPVNYRVFIRSPFHYIRIDGDDLLTSLGCRCPIEDFRKAIPYIESAYMTKFEYIPSEPLPLGEFRLDRIDIDGTVHCSCHAFTKVEAELAIELTKHWVSSAIPAA